MKTITFKTRCGKYVVTVDKNDTVFNSIPAALTFIFKERGLLK